MATRSTIALEFANGTVGQVYAHWDGYLAHNGKILLESYSDPFKLRDLIDLGGVSSLGANLGEQHPFSEFEIAKDDPERDAKLALLVKAKAEGWTTFYGRDRGETEMGATSFKDINDYYENCQGEEYDYILSPRNGKAQWYVRYHDTQGNWIRLEHAFENEAAELEA